MTRSKNTKRIFLGIPVPNAMHDLFIKLLQPFQSHFLKGSWILPENLHITIRFFGDIDSTKMPLLFDNIKNKVALLPSFSVGIEKIAVFPDENGSFVVAYPCTNSNLENVFSIIQSVDLNFKKNSEKKFMPHITLYRNHHDVPMKIPTIPVVNCKLFIEKLVLYESMMIDNKRVYRPLYFFPLKQ